MSDGAVEQIEKVMDEKARPTFTVLVAITAVAVVVLTAFFLLSDFVKGKVREGLEPAAAAATVDHEELKDHEARLRAMEQAVGQLNGIREDTKEILKRIPEKP